MERSANDTCAEYKLNLEMFRHHDGHTEVMRKGGKWVLGMNFTMDVIRIVTGGQDQGGPIVRLNSPLLPGREL